MTTTEKQEIIAYLSGPRNYTEGVRLYERHGHNRMYKRRFALEDTEFTRALLAEELRKLAGLSEAEFKRLPRLAKMAAPTSVSAQPVPESGKQYAEAPEVVSKMTRFREKYSFLNRPDCPDILKVLVNDMFAAYDTYKTAFAHLQTIPDETIAEAATEAEKVVTAYLTNREIRDELEHYRTTGEILGKAAKFRELEKAEPAEDLTALSDLDLVKKLNSARTNQSKQRAAIKKAQDAGKDAAMAEEALAAWTETRARIEAEIESRKKN